MKNILFLFLYIFANICNNATSSIAIYRKIFIIIIAQYCFNKDYIE